MTTTPPTKQEADHTEFVAWVNSHHPEAREHLTAWNGWQAARAAQPAEPVEARTVGEQSDLERDIARDAAAFERALGFQPERARSTTYPWGWRYVDIGYQKRFRAFCNDPAATPVASEPAPARQPIIGEGDNKAFAAALGEWVERDSPVLAEHAAFVAWVNSHHPDAREHLTAWNGWEGKAQQAAVERLAGDADAWMRPSAMDPEFTADASLAAYWMRKGSTVTPLFKDHQAAGEPASAKGVGRDKLDEFIAKICRGNSQYEAIASDAFYWFNKCLAEQVSESASAPGEAIDASIAQGYEGGIMASNANDDGATITLHYDHTINAECAFEIINTLIDQVIAARQAAPAQGEK